MIAASLSLIHADIITHVLAFLNVSLKRLLLLSPLIIYLETESYPILITFDRYGQFFSGDSYVVLYEYKDKRGKDAAFIYYWQVWGVLHAECFD